ncbi:MAG: cold shock domain-containing protein [Nitrospirae bacterium]|nr:cold shock domain-containing protein [Nitrospirota bacterium]
MREIGIVKWYDSAEGSGYIVRKKGEDVYVQCSAVICGSDKCELKEGDAVEFTVFDGSNGPQAKNVKILK